MTNNRQRQRDRQTQTDRQRDRQRKGAKCKGQVVAFLVCREHFQQEQARSKRSDSIGGVLVSGNTVKLKQKLKEERGGKYLTCTWAQSCGLLLGRCGSQRDRLRKRKQERRRSAACTCLKSSYKRRRERRNLQQPIYLTKKRTDSFTERRLRILRVLFYKEGNDNDNKPYSTRNKDWNYNLYRRYKSASSTRRRSRRQPNRICFLQNLASPLLRMPIKFLQAKTKYAGEAATAAATKDTRTRATATTATTATEQERKKESLFLYERRWGRGGYVTRARN